MDRKGVLRIICLIIPLFFIGLALCSLHVSWAEESPLPISQIVLTDENGQEFSEGILLDNFEYWNNPDTMGWELIDFWSPYSYIWNCSPSLYLNTLLDSDHGSGDKVLDVYMPSSVFLIETLQNETCAIRKMAAYADPNGVVFDCIPGDFNFLYFEVKAPLPVEQFQIFRFEVQVKTDNNGYAWIVIFAEDKPEGVSPVNGMGTVGEDVEPISLDPQNPSIIEMYIGDTYADGRWHHLKIDLNAVIKKYSDPDEELAQILSVTVRGNKYRLDNILFAEKDYPDNTVPHLFHIGLVYLQFYGPEKNSAYRWIYAEDPDLMITAEKREKGIRFPGIADDSGIVLEYENETLADQNIDLETLHVYEYWPGVEIADHNAPRSPDDADLDWRIIHGGGWSVT